MARDVYIATETVISQGVLLNSSTPSHLVTTTEETIRVIMTNRGNQDAWIKFQGVSVDNDKKGVILYKGTSTDVIVAPAVYAGDICAMTEAGSTTIFVTSY